jgi:hypothetical protein
MKYEDIKKANELIKTTDIKGKQYAEVPQRIKAFRSVCPNGSIITELLSNENGICIFKAQVFDDNAKMLGTGHAYEKENSSFINKTSYIENCETSAVGRALGMAGFGIETSIASFEEVANAVLQQKKEQTKNTVNPNNDEFMTGIKKNDYIDTIKELCTDDEIQKLCAQKKVNELYDMTETQLEKILKLLEKRGAENA